MGTTHRHAAPLPGGRAGVDRRPGRRSIDPTNVRLVGLAIYLGIIVVMVAFAGPASASEGGRTTASTLSALPSILFLLVVGGGLFVRAIRRRGHLPEPHHTTGPIGRRTHLGH